jgi:hypothetical protein
VCLKENETNWWFGVLQNLELITKLKYDFFNENFTRAGVKGVKPIIHQSELRT